MSAPSSPPTPQPLDVDRFDAGAAEHEGYRRALEHLYGRLDTEKLDPKTFATVDRELKVFADFLERLGHPEHARPTVHVTGTRGKGSFVASLEAILLAAGYTTGATVSPHLVEVRERIRLGGADLSRDLFARYYDRVRPVADQVFEENRYRTVFELLTALAFITFREEEVDWALVEVGLGGRLDATNVVQPALAAVTRIGLDHTHLLGDTVEKIAWDKGHIIKSGAAAVLGPQNDAAMEVLEARCREVGVTPWRMGRELDLEVRALSSWGSRFTLDTPIRRHRELATPLLGAHMAENAAMAVAAADRLHAEGLADIPPSAVREGLLNTRWPGRGEVLRHDPVLLLDGAHTPQGATALSHMLDSIWPDAPRVMVLGFNHDKDARGFLRSFGAAPARVFATAADTPRAMPPDEVAALVREHGWEAEPAELDEVLDRAIAACPESGVIVASGSLYIVGALRRRWLTGAPR